MTTGKRRINVTVWVKILSFFKKKNTQNQTITKGICQAMHTSNFLKWLGYELYHPEVVVLFPARTRDEPVKCQRQLWSSSCRVPEFLSPGIKRPGREAHLISPPTDNLIVRVDLLLLWQQRCNLSQAYLLPLLYKICLQLRIGNFHLYIRRYS